MLAFAETGIMQSTSVQRLSINRAQADELSERDELPERDELSGQQGRDPVRVARWRQRAEVYRTCAEACATPGSQRAYRALAACAACVADRIGDPQARGGAATRR
jgi:hypothetical protein